jgi:hypothetical protein
MALVLKQIFTTGSDEIAQNYIIESWHVSQSVDAFTGAAAYDITISGSLTLTGSVQSRNGFTGSLLGTAATSSKANNMVVNNNATTNQIYRLTYVLDSGMPSVGNSTYLPLNADSGSDGSGLSYNPSNNSLTASLFSGTASWATNVVNTPTPSVISGVSYPSGSAKVPGSLFSFIAGANKTGTSNTASIQITELVSKNLGQEFFVTATVVSGSGPIPSIKVSGSIVGNVLTFESSFPNTDFNYIIMYI